MRFGVEEEFFVVDPVSRAVVARAETVHKAAKETMGNRVDGEITKLQVEARTEPCYGAEPMHAQLTQGRQALAAAAAAEGLRIMASGTPILGDYTPPPITEGPRQTRGNETFRGLHDELAICAMHVHVEMSDRDRAVMVSNHLRAHLPTLISLSANSPFWGGRDTGYASWRTMTWPRWPVAGPPPYFHSAEHYDRLVDTMLEAGALVDRGTIFWDIRPSAHQSTLEIRVCDVPGTAWETALLASLIRALAIGALAAAEAGDPGPVIAPELMRVAYWRAARDGLAGHGVDVHTGQLIPAPELARHLLSQARPGLAAYGEVEQVTGWLDRLLEYGDGATRQRASLARDGQLNAVVDDLILRTAQPMGTDFPGGEGIAR